ncbi:hypothetical protein [Streptomyces sp. ISL-100]|uniref:hypothetical protein n=1 Tax=Streptomyces sp. ISL-100 TaxID=2819173 RepID=UPI0020351E58|nr:hypothetical protein [Streptomyces sp. ISL-100]
MITAAGDGVNATWKDVLAGMPTATHDPLLAGLPVTFSCRIAGLEDVRQRKGGRKAWHMGCFVKPAVLAAREAARDASLDPRTWTGERVAVVLRHPPPHRSARRGARSRTSSASSAGRRRPLPL